MIRMEIVCGHSEEPRARDAKAPCDSNRGRSLALDANATLEEAVNRLKRHATAQGWKLWILPALGRRKGYICGNCYRRAKGDI